MISIQKKLLVVAIFVFIVVTIPVMANAQATSTTSLSPEIQSLYNQALNLINQGGGGVDTNTGLPNGFDEQISIKTSPNYPKPNQPMTVYLESYSTDLNKAIITWKRDGTTILEGRGAKQLTITAPDNNESSTISATINKSNGGVLVQNIVLSPSQVEIIYEPFTYTPPFYKGRSLFTSQSAIKFVAVASFFNNAGQRYNASDLIYQWTINGQVYESVSGAGKNIFYYQSPLIQRDMVVGVNVLSPNSNTKAKDEVEISLYNPQVFAYENNPIYGSMFEKAVLNNFLLNRSEVELTAVPFFFNTDSRENINLQYKWLINGEEIQIGPTQGSVIFGNQDDIAGSSQIGIVVNKIDNLLQQSQTSLRINFQPIANTASFEF